jgi:hypothetical protein
MQAVNKEQSVDIPIVNEAKISAEVLAYALLILIALVLRFANLGLVPMTDLEAVQALPAYHVVNPNAPGIPQASQSVITFWLQRMSFTIFGGTEFAARFSGAISGIVLILMPVLFRSRFGAGGTFLLSLILATSPIAFAAARFADPVIWTMIFTIALLWAVWVYWDSRSLADALRVALFAAAMIFLSESGGLLLAIILILSAFFTVVWMIYNAPDELDDSGEEILQSVQKCLHVFPINQAVLASFALVVTIATGALLYPSGLSIVGETLANSLTGIVQPYISAAPPVFALLSLFLYEPYLVIFAIVSAVLLVSARNDTVLDRFVIVWALVAFAIMFIYQGTKPAFALWIVLPSAYLTMRLVIELLVNYMPALISLSEYYSNDPNDYAWIKWVIALVAFAISIMLGVHLSQIGRGLLDFPVGESLSVLSEPRFLLFRGSLVWFVISLMMTIVGFFLASSIWGNRNTIQGFGLGFFAFMLTMGLGTGWNIAVTNISEPAELWNTSAIAPDARILRQTLFEVARRETVGFPEIPIRILVDESAGVSNDGLIAWLVRDFENANFVTSIAEVKQDEIILLPKMDSEPELGGSYVGQSFAIRQYGVNNQIGILDWVSWFTQRKTRRFTLPEDIIVLWLRLDIYDGTPINTSPNR